MNSNLCQIYAGQNSLEEFAKIHKFLKENEGNLGKLLKNSIEREKMARSKMENKKIKNGEFEESLEKLEKIERRENGELEEWRRQFEKAMSNRYAKSERIRFVFCRKMYGHYVERVRQIQRLSKELRTCKERRLLRKFELDEGGGGGRVLMDRNSGKPYISYEDIFDAIHECYRRTGINEMRVLFSELKEFYANITFECVLEYFKIRGKTNQQKQGEWRRRGNSTKIGSENGIKRRRKEEHIFE